MKMARIGCIAVAAILIVAVIVGMSLLGRFNTMVQRQEGIKEAWAQVENVLQRRGDLIPNLVETVKGYAAQEKEIFINVAQARSRLAGASGPQEAAAANAGMNSALSRLLAIAENYPQLKSNENFIRLQDELAGSENRIANERRKYNTTVREYNLFIKTFPNRLLAGIFGFTEEEYFQAEEGTKEVPEVKFGG